jgi:hypothetical protein
MLFTRARKGNYRLFVLHDADPHGYNIARTLAEETRRMPGHSVEVTDLGLGLEEALAMGLQTETFIRQKALPISLDLNEAERHYFEGEFKGRKQWESERVELNAFTPSGLIAFLERKLSVVGADTKIVPPPEILESHSKTAYADAIKSWIYERGAKLLGFDTIASSISRRFELRIGKLSLHELANALAEERNKQWRTVVHEGIARGLNKNQERLIAALTQEIQEQLATLAKRHNRE